MTFDVFGLRDEVTREYREYFESFVHIDDPDIECFVRRELDRGAPWPDAVLQLNPAYESGATLAELAEQGAITPQTARLFGPNLRLHRHQAEALAVSRQGTPYIVTTGTGSGKSLTYLIPIVDHVFRNDPGRNDVRAVIVYPMNALINSQLQALERFRAENWPDCPVRFARYTGQESNEDRDRILQDPPHILLTNYVMLEYMLIRPYEAALVSTMTRDLQFVVMDELHVYRGRQGADVAMLMRRVRQAAGGRPLQYVGTSATLVSTGTRGARNRQIAEVASTLFGTTVPPAHVIDESLSRVATATMPRTVDELRAAIEAPLPAPKTVRSHPLAAWIEGTFGLREVEGRLVRQEPASFKEAVERLAHATGLDEERCAARLQAVLQTGMEARTESGDPVFAFRLHQFLASGSSVYATVEPSPGRLLTTEGQVVVSSDDGENGGRRLLFPLTFCRECGQEHYQVSWIEEGGEAALIPRSPLLYAADDDTDGRQGYFAPERNDLWAGDEGELPDFWLEETRAGMRVRSNYRSHVPERVWVRPDGRVSQSPIENAIEGWFQPRPFMLCLRCRTAYDLRQRGDFAKLTTLSQTGRSTATTLTVSSTIGGLRRQPIDSSARKVLSFTDNRQDASLQAGHLNDFVQVALLRNALAKALEVEGGFGFERLGFAAFEAMAPEPQDFMRHAREEGSGWGRARTAMIDLLQYRAFEDLRRAWRVAQPNLEQCGLLRIEYDGLRDLAARDDDWSDIPGMGEVGAGQREAVLRALLDHLRSNLAIDARCLEEDAARQLFMTTQHELREPWAVDEQERPRPQGVAVLPGATPPRRHTYATVGLGWRSTVGRYLRSRHTWGLAHDLDAEAAERVVSAVVDRLRGHILTALSANGEDWGIQIAAGALHWRLGDGTAAPPDRVRSRSLHIRREEHLRESPNEYFRDLYHHAAAYLKGVRGREHTGQVAVPDRIEREREFREGTLAALFCSPTMELGVDISDLTAVHMRNVPPTPANYAQRSGRAGRGGRPALVLTFCSQGNAHDEHYFRHRNRMIAGAVQPARMDLANKELIEAHLNSVWLGIMGIALGSSMDEILDLEDPAYPLLPGKLADLERSVTRQQRVIDAVSGVIGDGLSAITSAEWYNERWLEETVRRAPFAFDRAFDRWRELYRSAVAQRNAARRLLDRRLPSDQRRAADRQELQAKREIELLLNQGERTETDFYPYRYLASEGFLPGYNFPRLPLRALVSSGDRAASIDRARFLGLREFGPMNVVYHEGRKHRVTSCIVPPGGLEARFTRARLCQSCGYIHPGSEALEVELCVHCNTPLNDATSDFPQFLFDQPAVRTSRWTRITSEEEERSREGYVISTHFRFAPDAHPIEVQVSATGSDAPLLHVLYAPRAQLWRVNRGWRRSEQGSGFTLDLESGRWRRRADGDEGTEDGTFVNARSHGWPYVTDSRNILLLRPPHSITRDPAALATLAYALQRGIQFVYQVEEGEVAVEPIGTGRHQRLLLWEAAEGGTGVWERLLNDPTSIAAIAWEALRVCHFDPDTGEALPEWEGHCAAACYDCLLSYSNQSDHRLLDRFLIREYLLQLVGARVIPPADSGSYEEHYERLLLLTDPNSPLERELLEFLHERGLKLPDRAQSRPTEDVAIQPDFYYERDGLPGICVFVDGPPHDDPEQAERDRLGRESLEDRGFSVLAIRYDRPFEEQLESYSEVFFAAAGGS